MWRTTKLWSNFCCLILRFTFLIWFSMLCKRLYWQFKRKVFHQSPFFSSFTIVQTLQYKIKKKCTDRILYISLLTIFHSFNKILNDYFHAININYVSFTNLFRLKNPYLYRRFSSYLFVMVAHLIGMYSYECPVQLIKSSLWYKLFITSLIKLQN